MRYPNGRTEAAVLAHLQRSEGASRAELARALGYAPSTMTSVVAEMLAQGVLEEFSAPSPVRGAGRPAARLRIQLHGNFFAVEFDHDQVHVGVTDKDGVIVASDSKAVDTAASPATAIHALSDLCRQVLSTTPFRVTDIRAAAIGLPGPVDTVSGVVGSSSVLPNWRDANVADLFRRHVADIPLWVDNDANLAALGELHRGAAQGLDNFIFVKASTGLGGCIYLGGELVRGRYGAAGEIGHVALPDERTACRCGNRGCLETVSSTPALLRQVANVYPDVTDLRMLKTTDEVGGGVTGRALFDMGARLGVHLAHLCTVLDVDHVIVGGELAEISEDYLDGARETTRRWVHPALARTIRVDGSALGSTGGLTGAAIAARQLALAAPR